jgi:hypothetical protein
MMSEVTMPLNLLIDLYKVGVLLTVWNSIVVKPKLYPQEKLTYWPTNINLVNPP